jgi:CPA1 family monovalent cation:H+ antiporter
MSLFDLVAALLVLTALLSYINYRLLKLPTTIGVMALTLLVSVAVVVIGSFLPDLERQVAAFVHRLDFDRTLMHGMLGFLLFAGALHIDLNDLARHKLSILLLATVGVLLSTALVGVLTWGLLTALGLPMRLLYCLLFGALISPTDPIAVLALLKKLGAPRDLEVQIAGESLFNDGIGVVVFIGLLGIATESNGFGPGQLAAVFLWEVVGGAALGLASGLLAYVLLRSVDNYQVEILLSLALVAGGYALADALHFSGPIAMVIAGLFIGNHGRRFAMSPTTVEHLDLFWELIDEILNAVLFVLIGLEVLVLPFTGRSLLAGVLAVPAVLLARLVSVAIPLRVLGRLQPFQRGSVWILTWGGLRGGISVAMALSLPSEAAGAAIPERQVILIITYVVVIFSILVQGLTIGPLTRRWLSVLGSPSDAGPHDGVGHDQKSVPGAGNSPGS